ncbi:sensor histidine kinase [Micromonospora sp. NPDC003197]
MGDVALSGSVALVLLRRAEHVLFIGLLAVGAARAVLDGRPAVVVLTGALLLGAWYTVGVVVAHRGSGLLTERTRAGWLGLAWLLVLTAGWAGLVTLSVDFVWLAFVLFLLYPQLLPLAGALPTVAVLTAGVIAAFGLHRGRLDPGAALGPVIGAAVAIVITLVYQGLRRETDIRDRLLAELTAAQDQLAATERRAGTLAERERLAREIHDTVAQSLSSIILLLRAARNAYLDAPAAARHQLDTATAAAHSALDDTRRLVRALAPAELVGRSLPEALRRLVDGTGEFGLDGRFTVEGEPAPLPTRIEVSLLRAAQEALGNVRSHAAARRVVVTLTYLPHAVSLDVADDGRGFDPQLPALSGPTAGTGLGLAAMRARLAEVGGSLVVESAPGHGTVLGATVPLTDEVP